MKHHMQQIITSIHLHMMIFTETHQQQIQTVTTNHRISAGI